MIEEVRGRCYSFGPLERDLPATRAATREESIIRVTSRSGGKEELIRTWVDSLTIRGESRRRRVGAERERVIIPLSEVRRIQVRHFDLKKTLIRSGLTMVIVVGGLALALSLENDPWLPVLGCRSGPARSFGSGTSNPRAISTPTTIRNRSLTADRMEEDFPDSTDHPFRRGP